MAFYDEMKKHIREVTRSQYSIPLLDALFTRPIFRVSDLVQQTGVSKPTIYSMVRQLKDDQTLQVLREGGGRRPEILVFPNLLRMAAE